MHADNWANKAKQMGYRSRAVFKLEEILQKLDSKKRYQNVLDLGSSPGGWSQYIKKKYNSSMVCAIDILDMEPIDGVNFYQESIECIENIPEIRKLKGSFNLVISDIAPNITGINTVDIENIYELNILTLKAAHTYIDKNNGKFIIKTFQNSMFKRLRKEMDTLFKTVQTFKPAASKKQSAEIYLYGAQKR
jgi:23S rRNA (uridine2552-2'-O)-methyltransferase